MFDAKRLPRQIAMDEGDLSRFHDQLVDRTQQPIPAIAEILFSLELAGLIYRIPGGYSR